MGTPVVLFLFFEFFILAFGLTYPYGYTGKEITAVIYQTTVVEFFRKLHSAIGPMGCDYEGAICPVVIQ